MESIAQALADLRQHMSQEAIAKALGISQSTISRWEAGRIASSAMDAARLLALAREVRARADQTQEGDAKASRENLA